VNNSFRLPPGTFAGRLLAVAVVLLAGVGGCATAPPVQEMSDARQAIAAADEAGAEEFAAEQLNQARDLLSAAERYLQSGTYWAARKAAISAKDTAFDALLQSRSTRDAPDRSHPR